MTDQENVRLEVTIDPRLVPIIGRSQYSSHPLTIVTRELLQNAIDASKRQGATKQVAVVIKYPGYGVENGVTITVLDHGDGMTPNIIRDKFFKLGATSKEDDPESVGGFGIAAASILSNDEWAIRTNDRVFTSQDYRNGAFTRNKRFRQGTSVFVRITGRTYFTDVVKAFQMIYYSDVDVKLAILDVHGRKKFYDPHAGFRSLGEPQRLPESTAQCELSILPKVRIGGVEFGYDDTGSDIVRIGGLVQFANRSSNERQTNLIFDIKPDHKPGDLNYELSASREEIRGPISEFVSKQISHHTTNAISSLKAVLEPEKPKDARLTPGKMATGTRLVRFKSFKAEHWSSQGWQEIDVQSVELTETGNLIVTSKSGLSWRFEDPTIENAIDQDGQAIEFDLDVNKLAQMLGFISRSELRSEMRKRKEQKSQNAAIAFFNKNYTCSSDELELHTKIVEVWCDILQKIAPMGESFGIGVLKSQYAEAERTNYSGDTFYLINPFTIAEEPDIEGMVARLWLTACHEITHKEAWTHDEKFTILMGRHIADTTKTFFLNQKKWSRMLQ